MNCKKTILSILIGISVLIGSNIKASAQNFDPEKPLFVEISTDWCFACKFLKPTIQKLEQEYGGKVNFLLLNASNEEAVKESELIASRYGLLNFFNSNRNAFPRVAVFCSSNSIPESNILGASNYDSYREVLDKLTNGSCNLSNSVTVADLGPGRPQDTEFPDITGEGRPELPYCLDRPKDILANISGRPAELTFWTIGRSIPISAYYQYLVLPKCSGNNIICSNIVDEIKKDINKGNESTNEPVYKPWTPNATRDEKGLKLIN